MGTEGRRRTTACISEAFGFLSNPEYSLGDDDPSTGSVRDSLKKNFEIFKAVSDEADEIVNHTAENINKLEGKSQDALEIRDENSNSEYTIVTYLDVGCDKDGSSQGNSSRCDSGFIQEVSFDSNSTSPDEFRIETYLEDSVPDDPGSINSTDHVTTETETSIDFENEELDSTQVDDPDMDGVVVLRHWHDSSKLDLDSESSGIGPSTSPTPDSQNPDSARKSEQRLGRGTKVVSDAFSFLKEIDNFEEGGERTNSRAMNGIAGGDTELNLRTKGLSIVSEGSTNSTSERNSSTTGSQSGSSRVLSSASVSSESLKSGHTNGKVDKRRQRSEVGSMGDNSDDSSDEDTGIYNESFRNSCWIQVDQNHLLGLSKNDAFNHQPSIEERDEDVFVAEESGGTAFISHTRSESTNTTISESEFKREYLTKRRAVVQRSDSQQEYHRMSTRFYDEEKILTVVKGENNQDYGLHILDSHPAVITEVDKGSPSERAGVKEGQILISVNGVNVLKASHQEIIQLIQKRGNMVQLEVASSDVYHVRDMDTPLMTGYMSKLSNSTFVKNWRRRYFVLRPDNCLYYFKSQQDQDPLGALPMMNYLVSRHTESNKENCFKAEKYGARTYYFMTDTREEMARWVGALNEAASKAKKKKDNWMDVTSHNVGIPALEIRKPDCSGYLSKCGRTMKGWSRRYCVLKDACMYYYKNMNSQSAQGMAHLHGYMIDDLGVPSKRNSILLRPPEPQMRTFSFCADNETDKRRWMAALNKSIQRWIKVD